MKVSLGGTYFSKIVSIGRHEKIKCSVNRGCILGMVSLRGQKISKFSLGGKKFSVEAGI